jgi:mannonate dehydratase
MRRRDFGGRLAAGAIGLAPGAANAAATPRKNTLMHVGGDYHSVAGASITSSENLEYNLRYGVRHLTAQVRKRAGGGWDAEELKRMRDDCDRSGMVFEAIRMDADYIAMRKGAGRDREIESIQENIRKASQVGVKVITYHWTVIPIRRNRNSTGRGNATYAGFKLEGNWKELPTGKAGDVSNEDYWERIGYFLEQVIPVAKQHNVKMACHPYDPPGLPMGYQGAGNWDSPEVFDAIRKYEAVVQSPFNGFQLCLGTVAEGLKHPGAAILPIVRYLGERGKIHQIHMRNIRGGLHDFQEVFPDEGEMDFFQVMRILRDVQFAGSICPDHMPKHAADAGGLQSFAFGYGYIKALIQAVNSEVS